MSRAWSSGLVGATFIWAAACLILLYCVTLAVYRVFFHPLAGYPGPFFAKLTDWYGGYNAMMMQLHLATYDDFQRYGPIVRYGPNKLLFNSATALKSIYVDHRIPKAGAYMCTLRLTRDQNTWSAVDRGTHRSRRKMVSAALAESFIDRFEPTLLGEINTCLSIILSACQQPTISPLDMTTLMCHLTLDITSQLTVGYRTKTQTAKTCRFIAGEITTAEYLSNLFIQLPFLAQPWLVSPICHLFRLKQRMSMFKWLQDAVEARVSDPSNAKYDMYHAVMDRKGGQGPESISPDLLRSEGLLFYIAVKGAGTASTALSALLFYLSRHASCYERLAFEIRSTFSCGVDIHTGKTLSSCRYLKACIDEALRMSPPLPGILWREVQGESRRHTDPLTVDGHVIPPGTQVGVCTYAIHHNPSYFSDPFSFCPERWLDLNLSEHQPQAFAPFSLGHRSCPGKHLAYTEISLTMAKLLWYFDFERIEGPLGDLGGGKSGRKGHRGRVDEFQLYDIFASAHQGPLLSFRTREEYWTELDPIKACVTPNY
ncbi:cytochrome P450 [Xylariaceae sp. FL0255]|nr:cytochrome P450 [Xylariaceae sp. FL0255]